MKPEKASNYSRRTFLRTVGTAVPSIQLAGWRRPPQLGVCDFPEGLVGAGGLSELVHTEDRGILQEVKPPARPRPIPWGTDQAALNRIVVLVV